MKALAAAIAESKRPALVVGPGVDRAEAVELMVKVAEKTKAAVWVSPFSARCSFPGTPSAIGRFPACLARPTLGRVARS